MCQLAVLDGVLLCGGSPFRLPAFRVPAFRVPALRAQTSRMPTLDAQAHATKIWDYKARRFLPVAFVRHIFVYKTFLSGL